MYRDNPNKGMDKAINPRRCTLLKEQCNHIKTTDKFKRKQPLKSTVIHRPIKTTEDINIESTAIQSVEC